MFKDIPLVIKKTVKSPCINNYVKKQEKFIKDKLDNILSPPAKKYLELNKQLQDELHSKRNKFKQ